MNRQLRKLFHELVSLTPRERELVLAQRDILPSVRAELHSLLQFDEPEAEELSRAVAAAAGEVLRAAAPGLSRCGPYRLLKLLGSGGMGSVYLASRADGEIQVRAAVKVLHHAFDSYSWRARFLQERQVLTALRHPAIVHMLDAGHTDRGRPYLVMELVEGAPIDAFAAVLPVSARLQLFLRVCDGVAHAHRHLVIHRDLKPANILVDSSGQPKVLDFGIARLLDAQAAPSATPTLFLTPNYASPEQFAGRPQGTATDIYSLGAVLYKVLTGRVPFARVDGHPGELVPPSHVNRNVPRDLDYIVAKALRAEPEERYVTVDDLAEDLRRVLDRRPVAARSGSHWYRARRFLRRRWLPLAAIAFVSASLGAGMWAAERERAVADRRFRDVRQLAGRLLDIEFEARRVPGATRTRELIVHTALAYLQRLDREIHGDSGLALEVANAYLRVARVQGVPTSFNLGQMEQADRNLQLASGLVASVVDAEPANRTALLRSAQIAHDRMLLARYAGRYDEALRFARDSAAWLQRFDAGRQDAAEASPILNTYLNVADALVRRQHFDEALQLARRATRFARDSARQDYVPDFLFVTAEIFRRQGALDAALRDIDQSVRLLEDGSRPAPRWQTMNLALALIIRGEILDEPGAISIGRAREALQSLARAYRSADQVVHEEPADQMSRSRLANAATVMVGILRSSGPGRALAICDHTLRHLAEISGNPGFRRMEVTLLVGSSYALRRAGRVRQARARLDAALAKLRGLGLYPAASIQLGSEVEDALRALAEHEAASGNSLRAAGLYRELGSLIQAGTPHPQDSLFDAVRLAALYRAEARIDRRAGFVERSAGLEQRAREIWAGWSTRLPGNAFVRRMAPADAVDGAL